MPSIVAAPYPDRGHVLLEINAADVPGATHVCVSAVTATGTRQLHPYVSYNDSGCIALLCGQAILWDTETSCGTPTVYTVTPYTAAGAVITTPAAPILLDTFTRTVAANFSPPAADTGQLYTTSGGAAADYSVNGTRGVMSLTTANVTRFATVPGPETNAEFSVTVFPTAVALTQPFSAGFAARSDVSGNGIFGRVVFGLAGVLSVEQGRTVAGVDSSSGITPIPYTYTATSAIRVVFQIWGDSLRIRAWDATMPDPVNFQDLIGSTGGVPVAGRFGLRAKRNTGNTNGTINVQFDDFRVTDVCADPATVTFSSETVNLACDGCFRLGDPVRPCNDVQVCLCAEGVECGGDGGLFFAGMTADNYASNSGSILPVNAEYPIPVSRNRRQPSGSFAVVPMSFADRDRLLALLRPGGVLLWRGPAEYGTGDRYLDVFDVPVQPPISDLRMQPRVMTLPFQTAKPVVGPSQGVCGARVTDLCDTYATWDAMAAAGVTWADLLRGDAGGVPSNLNRWSDTLTDNVTWAGLQANETDWADTLDGNA